MSLVHSFKDCVAAIAGCDRAAVELERQHLKLGGHQLEAPGAIDLLALFTGATLVYVEGGVAQVNSRGVNVTIARVEQRARSEYGVVELSHPNTWLFMGEFGSLLSSPDLSVCPEMLLALACFEPLRRDASLGWDSLLEAWGPLVVCHGDLCRPALAEVGCFVRSEPPILPEFSVPSCGRAFIPRPTAVPEALQAYVSGLQSVDGPDVAFLRFYRIFELEFAATIKAEISSSPLSRVYEMLRSMHGASEMDVLKRTIVRTPVSFSRFTRGHFESLFGVGYRPVREQYRALAQWLNGTSNIVPDGARAHVLYFVRNALVHSKLIDTEQFLFGPFNGTRASALNELVSDMKEVLRDLLSS